MILEKLAPEVEYHFAELPLTKLHYVTCGEGSPLIMVPATISKITNWLPLAQFMGQQFKVYFFELPGHGESTPFPTHYASELVAETMAAFIDYLGYDSVALLGFSFGGVLSLQTLLKLQDRVEKVILISPCVSHRAILLSESRKTSLKKFLSILSKPLIQTGFVKLLHSKRFGYNCANMIRRLGRIENTIAIEEILCGLPKSTVDVLTHQANEILNIEFPSNNVGGFRQKCYFAMSIHDPVLDFQTTLDFLEGYFEEVLTERFTFPYHQPPILPTFDDLNRDYGHFLALI